MYKLVILYLNVFFLLVMSDSPIITIPKDGQQELTVGSSLEIGCIYESNRLIEWKKDGITIRKAKHNGQNENDDDDDNDDNYEMDDNKLKIKNGRRNTDEGQYSCVFENGQSVTINVSAKPLLERITPVGATIDGKSINVEEDTTLLLQCTANSSLPITFKWFTIKNITKPDNTRHYFDESFNVTDSSTTLTLSDLKRDDRAYYGCEVTDKRNRTVTNIVLVRVKSKYAALWPFFGILGEVIILCTVIFIYEKRRQKPDFSDATDNANESHSPLAQTSSKGQEIRQRK